MKPSLSEQVYGPSQGGTATIEPAPRGSYADAFQDTLPTDPGPPKEPPPRDEPHQQHYQEAIQDLPRALATGPRYPVRQKGTSRLMTKDGRIVDVPTSGNRWAASNQMVGYVPGYGFGIIKELVIDPIADRIKDAHISRGFQHGMGDASVKVDRVKRTVQEKKRLTEDEAREKAICLGMPIEDANKSNLSRLCRFIALQEIPEAFEYEYNRQLIQDEFKIPQAI